MKISPVPNITNLAPPDLGAPQASNVQSLRTMKMNTNITPQSNLPPPQEANLESQVPADVPTAATQALSPQLALLAKQRRALQRERELFNQEKVRQAQKSATPSIDLARLKQEPLDVLLENGVTYEQLTEAILHNQKNSEVYALQEKVKQLEEGIDKRFTEKATQEEQAALSYMRREAEKLIFSGDQFELVRETKSLPTVMGLVERTYRKTGEVLDMPEALRLVEDELLNDALKLQKLKKLQSQLSPQAPQIQQPQQRQTGMRTLTNRDTATAPMSRQARALAAWHGRQTR